MKEKFGVIFRLSLSLWKEFCVEVRTRYFKRRVRINVLCLVDNTNLLNGSSKNSPIEGQSSVCLVPRRGLRLMEPVSSGNLQLGVTRRNSITHGERDLA